MKTKPINIYFHHPAQFQSPCWIFTISSSESYRPTFAIQIHTKILTIQYTYLYFVRSTWNIEISTFWQAYRKAQSYIYMPTRRILNYSKYVTTIQKVMPKKGNIMSCNMLSMHHMGGGIQRNIFVYNCYTFDIIFYFKHIEKHIYSQN